MFHSPGSFVKDIGDPIPAFRNIELSVNKVLTFHQINSCQIADDPQMKGTAVIICRIVPATGSGKGGTVYKSGSFSGDQIKMSDFYIAVAVSKTISGNPFFQTVIVYIFGEISLIDFLMTFRSFPRRKGLLFGNAAPLVIEAPCVDVKGFIQSSGTDSKIHTSADAVNVKIIFSGSIERGVIQLQHLLTGKGNTPFVLGVIPAQTQGVFEHTFMVGTFP